MLARAYGEEVFLKILRNLVAGVAFRQVSTEVFIDLIERISQRQRSRQRPTRERTWRRYAEPRLSVLVRDNRVNLTP